jgi:hypothetical protein
LLKLVTAESSNRFVRFAVSQEIAANYSHLGLNNGYKSVGLADCCVAGKAICTVALGDDGWSLGNGHYGSPLCETSASLVILCASFCQPIKALAPGFAVGADEGHKTLVHL